MLIEDDISWNSNTFSNAIAIIWRTKLRLTGEA